MITNINQLDFNKHYTYADYLKWQFEERVELLKGRIHRMSPAPNLRHQRIAGDIFVEIKLFLKGKSCQVFIAPFDVRLPLPPEQIISDKVDTVVQPDITVVCDEAKLDTQGCIGAPDIVIEVLSPGNTKKEMRDKLAIYQHAGIPEYWVVDPDRVHVIRYNLNENGAYQSSLPFVEDDKVGSEVLEGFELNLEEIF